MDVTELAVATIYILKPHLPMLTRHQPLSQSDEVAQQLWNSLYPVLTTNNLATEALNQVVESPSEDNFNVLKARLESLFYKNKTAGHRIAYIIGLGIQQEKLSGQPAELAPFTDPGFLENLSQKHVPAVRSENLQCSVCGRQDETLREVSFPYVVSLIRITWRRTFSGLWCERHARWHQILACLITTTVGWLGYGIMYVPGVLQTLLKGGRVNKETTLRALQAVTQQKLDEQDTEGAIQVIETALRLSPDNLYFQQQLYALDSPAPSAEHWLMQFLNFLGVLLFASLTGMVIGAGDYLVVVAFENIFPASDSIFVFILSWIPLVIALFTAGMIFIQVIQKALVTSHTRNTALAVSLAVFSSLLLINGILVGNVLLDMIFYWEAIPLFDALLTIGYVLTEGSYLYVAYYAVGYMMDTPTIIYLLILVSAAVFYLFITISRALEITRWRKRLVDTRQQIGQESFRAPIIGWLPMIGTLLSCLVLIAFFSLFFSAEADTVDYEDYADPVIVAQVEDKLALIEEGEVDQVAEVMNEDVELFPEDALSHWGVGLVDYQKGDCQAALTEFETADSLQPPPELSPYLYHSMGQAYECLYDYEQALLMYEQAIDSDPTLTESYLDMGLMHLKMGSTNKALRQFVQATTVDPWSSAAHSLLAIVYYQIGREETMTTTIDQAQELLTGNPYDQWAIGMYCTYRGELLRAESHFEKGLERNPNDFTISLQLAETYAALGKFEEAHQLLDQVEEAPWNETALHLSRSRVYVYQENLDFGGPGSA